jgi:hypothetical protein
MLIVIVAIFVFIISMLRSKKLDLKYCLVWLIGLLGVAVFCLFPGLLAWLSALLGIGLPVNMLYLISIVFLTCISISLTIVVSRLSDRLRQLAQNIAIVESERETNKESETKDNG